MNTHTKTIIYRKWVLYTYQHKPNDYLQKTLGPVTHINTNQTITYRKRLAPSFLVFVLASPVRAGLLLAVMNLSVSLLARLPLFLARFGVWRFHFRFRFAVAVTRTGKSRIHRFSVVLYITRICPYLSS